MPQPIPFRSPESSRPEHKRILSAQSIRGLEPPASGRVDYFDDQTPGLSLRITANDVRSWTFFYRDKTGRQKRLTLGRYDPEEFTLADARDQAHRARGGIAKGGDPAQEKRDARTVCTFEQLKKDYLELHAKPNKRSWKEDERQISADLLPKWKHLPAGEIARRDVRELLDRKVASGSPVAANRLRTLISKIFNFAVERDHVEHNPVVGVRRPAKETSRDRVLTDDEIRRIWNACDTQTPLIAAWFRLRLVTAQRGGEILQMRWKDINDSSEFWTIPKEFVKNDSGHRVYLNEMAREILAVVSKEQERREQTEKDKGAVWVFPESEMGDYKHVARRLAQPTRANIVVDGQNAKRDSIVLDRQRPKKKQRLTAEVRGHDLRRTAASLMASGGVPRFVISRILNHSEEKDITGVYDRYSYDAEKRAAMKFWERQLTAVLKGKSLARVGRFKMPMR